MILTLQEISTDDSWIGLPLTRHARDGRRHQLCGRIVACPGRLSTGCDFGPDFDIQYHHDDLDYRGQHHRNGGPHDGRASASGLEASQRRQSCLDEDADGIEVQR